VREELLKLCQVQELDLAMDKREKLLAGLDDGQSAKAEVERLNAELAQAGQNKKQTDKEYFDRELELKGIEAKRKKAEDLMYSGRVSNLKELKDLQQEVEMFKREIDVLSTRVLELMDEQEEHRKKEKESRAALEQAQKSLQAVLGEYEATSARLKEEIVSLQSQRQELAQTISQPLLRRYEQMQSKQGILAAVAMKNEVCAGCHVTIPSHLMKAIREAQSVQTCDSCGRMLIWAVAEEEETEAEQ